MRRAVIAAFTSLGLIAVFAPSASAQTFNPTSLSFGPQPFRTTSAPKTVTLTNTTGVPFESNVHIRKTYDAGFFETDTCPDFPALLGVGASCSISVTFAPYDPPVNTRSATLHSSETGTSIPLSGQAVFSTGGKGKKCKKKKGKKGASAAKKKCKKK